MISSVRYYATVFTNLIRDIWQGTRIDENADPSDMSKPSGPQQWTHTILQIKIYCVKYKSLNGLKLLPLF